jgi:hypothetical protein
LHGIKAEAVALGDVLYGTDASGGELCHEEPRLSRKGEK